MFNSTFTIESFDLTFDANTLPEPQTIELPKNAELTSALLKTESAVTIFYEKTVECLPKARNRTFYVFAEAGSRPENTELLFQPKDLPVKNELDHLFTVLGFRRQAIHVYERLENDT